MALIALAMLIPIAWQVEPVTRNRALQGLLGVGTLIGLAGLAAPGALRPVYKPWMAMGMFLGGIMTVVLMTVLYFVVVPVFSLIRLKDPLRMRRTRSPDESFWEPHRNSEPTVERFSKPF